jgi:hypothetical protein
VLRAYSFLATGPTYLKLVEDEMPARAKKFGDAAHETGSLKESQV